MERHVTILLNGDTPTVSQCTSSGLFRCPFCKYKAAKPMLDSHIKGHSSVKCREFTMIKCGLTCRTATHFHCCYCAATIINRSQLLRHLEIHQEEEDAAAPKENMLEIRRWWCLVLLQNFPMPSEEDRLRERKRRHEGKGLQDVEEVPPKRFRHASEASDEAENMPGLGTGSRVDHLLQDTMEAARWCDTKALKGKLSLPKVLSMDTKDCLRAVEVLYQSGHLDPEEEDKLREPFMFLFSVRDDYEAFCQEIMDKRKMQTFCSFEPQP